MNKYSSIKKVCKINDGIFSDIIDSFNNHGFKTEKEIADFILKRFKQLNVKPAFPSIVANNKWEIHPLPRKKKLEKGFLILDFGCKLREYCSDMTRTIFLGKPNAFEKRLYELVLRCQRKSVKGIKIGMRYRELDRNARKMLKHYRKYFVHSLGHGVGKKIHEKPAISRNSDDVCRENDFITIEPGIYIPNRFGIRIEDTLFIGNEVEVLTKARKDLICVEI